MKTNTMWVIGIIALLIFLNSTNEKHVSCPESVVSMESLSGHTTITEGHIHAFTVDINGEGVTAFNDGHQHRIFNFQAMFADGHTHELAR